MGQFSLPPPSLVVHFLSSSRKTTSCDQTLANHQLATTADTSGGCCSAWQLLVPPLHPAEGGRMPSPVPTPQLESLPVPWASLCQWELSQSSDISTYSLCESWFCFAFLSDLGLKPLRQLSLPCCAGIPKLILTPNQFSFMSSMPIRLVKMLHTLCLYYAGLWSLPPSCYLP